MSDNIMESVKTTQNNDVESKRIVSNDVRIQEHLTEHSHVQTSSGHSIRTRSSDKKSHGRFVGVTDIGQQSKTSSTTPEQRTPTGLGVTAAKQHGRNSTAPNKIIEERFGRSSAAPDEIAMTQYKGISIGPDQKSDAQAGRFPAAAKATAGELYTIHASPVDCTILQHSNTDSISSKVKISEKTKTYPRAPDFMIPPKARRYSIAQIFTGRSIRGSRKARNSVCVNLRSAKDPLDQKFRDQEQARQHSHTHLSAVRSIKLLLITICITNGPFQATSIIWTYYKFWMKVEPSHLFNYIQFCSLYLTILNSCLNSGLIIYGNTRCRRYIRSMFRRNPVTQSDELA
eukprot:Seg3384.2 transcript_id=Seg3384.2/GoldUCD/mRNA.D3Y31 product="hypothetical protein" protein_id=Seg3384.2/GoldUCD/D3Y31